MENNLNDYMSSTPETTIINASDHEIFVAPATNIRAVSLSQDLFTSLLNGAAYFSVIVGVPGIIANVLIIVTYTKMGITNSINASYTAMAISDLGCVVTTMWFEILLMPQFQAWGALPFIPFDVLSTTAAYPNMAFAKTTACITAYISLERCLCVASPHKVKLLFTRNLTIIVLIFIGIFNAVPAALTGFGGTFVWKTSPIVPNKTVLGRVRHTSRTSVIISDVQEWLYGTVYQWVPIGITVICSIFLVVYLRAGSKWRNTTLQTLKKADKKDPKSSKEDRVVQTVLMISLLSIILSTPVSLNFILSGVAPQLAPFASATALGTVLAAHATALTMVNSCLNIVVYYRLGTKFRLTLKQLLKIDVGTELVKSKGAAIAEQ